MKIKPEDFDELKALISPYDNELLRKKYVSGDFVNSDKVKDLNKRYRWDLYWSIASRLLGDRLYRYMNDTHIDTALRTIIKDLK